MKPVLTNFKLIVLICLTVLLSGCNLEQLFSLLSQSEQEQAAGQAVKQSAELQAKLQRIETKKAESARYAELVPTIKDVRGTAFVFLKDLTDSQFSADVEAVLVDPKEKKYEVWLTDSSHKEYLKLGQLASTAVDDYRLTATLDGDAAEYTQTLLSLESNFDDQPEAIIMVGSFPKPTEITPL